MGHRGWSPGLTTNPSGDALPARVPAVKLAGPGPGEELVAHLVPVLEGLDTGRTTAPSRRRRVPVTAQEEQDLLDLLDAQ